ncbi:MAG: hypothetical protein GXP28_08915, partial [Planctomycetes bacterium]|nr:hypothetical protein [Planctomycetota bacterium]
IFGLNFPAPLAFAKLATGLDEGLRRQGDLLVALLPGENKTSEPQPMVLLPVDDYAKFAASIEADPSGEICRVTIAGENVLVAQFGEYALMMDVEHRETLELLLGLQQAPVASLKPLDFWLEKNDVVIALMPQGVEALLSLGKKTLAQQQEQLEGELDDPQVSVLLQQMEINAEIFQWVLESFETEIKLVAVAISLDKEANLRISKRVLLKESGKLISGASEKATAVSPLLGYADQPFVVVGGGPLPESWTEALSAMSRKFMERMPELYGLEEMEGPQWEKLQDSYLSLMKGLKSSSMIVLPGKEGEPLFSNIFGVMKTGDAAGYLESYRTAIELWNEIMENSTSDIALQYEITSKTIGTKKACEIVVDVASAAQDPNVPGFNWMLEAMFGEDGKMRQLLVAANEQTLVYGMANEEQLVALIPQIENGESGLLDSAEVQMTLKLSPADAPWRLLISPQGCVKWGKRIMDEFLTHLMGQTPEIPDFDSCPPVGLSVNLVEGRVEADLVCPVETLEALAAYIEKCREL